MPVVRNDLTSTVCNLESAIALSREGVRTGKTAKVHLKIDSGMGRVGIDPETTVEFMRKIKELPGLQVSGIFSHMATADEKEKSYAKHQIQVFSRVVANLKTAGLLPEKVHLANSAGIMELPESHFNMVRAGIMLYGLYPSNEVNHKKANLKPVLSLKAKITFVKRVAKGTGISYGQKYHTERESTIATIPIGYADGWSRMLSNKVEAIVRGRKFPVVGTICMDQCMIDLKDEPINIGEEVILIGASGKESITTDIIAEKLGTINYEVACMLSNRLPKVFVEEK
jgi:alanine racemase